MRALTTVLAALLASGCGPALIERPRLDAAVSPSRTGVSVQSAAVSRGHTIAVRTCGGCHATGAFGPSPRAGVPPFRDIVARRSLDDIEAAMAQGLVTTHPAMLPFAFRAGEIDDMIAHLDALRSTRHGQIDASRPGRGTPLQETKRIG